MQPPRFCLLAGVSEQRCGVFGASCSPTDDASAMLHCQLKYLNSVASYLGCSVPIQRSQCVKYSEKCFVGYLHKQRQNRTYLFAKHGCWMLRAWYFQQ
jgi:hypothetical protein